MGLHAQVTHIDLTIRPAAAKQMRQDLGAQGLLDAATASAADYLTQQFCEVTSSRSGLRITDIRRDQIDEDLYALLDRLAPYVSSGSFVKFSGEDRTWAMAVYEQQALLPLGELLAFKKKPQEVAVSSQWGDRGHDSNTLVHDATATEEKLKDFWYWRHGVLKLALRVADLGESLGHLKSLNKKIVGDVHSLCGITNDVLTGKATLSKYQVNTFADDAPRYAKRLLDVIATIENRPDAQELPISRRAYQ
jgi:hypothetical protein